MHHVYPTEHPETAGIRSFPSSQQAGRHIRPTATDSQVKELTKLPNVGKTFTLKDYMEIHLYCIQPHLIQMY